MRLFGTDGIRGVAKREPVTADTAVTVGRAAAHRLCRGDSPSSMVIGTDTRMSGSMLASAVAAGAASAGTDVYLAGVVPTPAVARLTKQTGAGAGIAISASHNPFQDNGIKVFDAQGLKLSVSVEREIESFIMGSTAVSTAESVSHVGRVRRLPRAGEDYADFVVNRFSDRLTLENLPVVLDCANGATSMVAPGVFARLGAAVTTLSAAPDGTNINQACGSEHPERLADKVVRDKASVGFAFDGDGDRLVAVDETGHILTGDQVLAICADFLKNDGNLPSNCVVSTIMSNMGLRISLEKLNIEHRITSVGDRHVQHEMIRCGAVLGGEDSGHLIFMDYHSTGDGIIAALFLLRVMAEQNRPLSQLRKVMDVLPQALVNVAVSAKPDLGTLPEVTAAIRDAEQILGKRGRVLVRYSGTQPLCRAMVEADSKPEAERLCRQIADALKRTIGSKHV